MPAPDYQGSASGAGTGEESIGAGADEVGIYLGDMSYSIDNPEVEFLDRWGGVIGAAIGHNASLTLDITGEVSDIDAVGGIGVQDYESAATIANDDFFAETGSTYHGINFATNTVPYVLRSASGDQPRGGARTISCSFIRRIGMTSI